MASKLKHADTQPAEPPVVIVIDESNKTDRELDVGGQKVHFRSPSPNILEQKASLAIGIPDSLVIDSDAMLVVADEELRRMKGTRAALDTMRESVSKPLYEAWSNNNAIYRKPVEIIDGAIKRLVNKIADYHEAVERRRIEEQRRADVAAEAERQRLAEQARVAEEQAAQSAMLGDEAEAEATFQQAEALDMASQLVTAQQVEMAPPRIAGSSMQYRYSAGLPQTQQEKIAAIKWLLANPQFLSLVTFDQKACNQLVVALKDNFAVPGMRVVKTPVVAQRGVRPSEEPW